MLVDFFIAGVQKSGTTALDRLLREHPAIVMANVKEIHFFDDDSIDWSKPDHARLHAAYDPDGLSNPSKIRGEATPIYTYWPNALQRIKQYNGAAKIIVGLRHPTFRAYSHWRMETTRHLETLSFSEAIRWPARARVSGAPFGVHRVFSYVERGFYFQQVDLLLSLFPPEQVAFYRTDQLWTEPDTVLGRLQKFLGIERKLRGRTDYIVPELTWHGEPISPADRSLLDHLFADDIRKTARRANVFLDDWLDPNYREPMRPVSDAR